jgi:hypothetical protein
MKNTQFYYMSVATVLYLFGDLFSDQKKDPELWTKNNFGNCSKKKNFLQDLFDLLLFFDRDL